MANEVSVPEKKSSLPAHLMDMFKPEDNDDLASGLGGGFGSLSIQGKEFNVVAGGERKTVLTVVDGEEVPARHLDVVLIKASKKVSKVYYKGKFVPGSDVKPDCWSSDGEKPDANVEKPQCGTCKLCPHNMFGSRISESGGKGKACGDSKRVAIALASDLERPLLLRVPVTSMRPLEEYGRNLAKRGVPYQAVFTRLGFEQGVTHPQLTYKPAIGFLDDAQAKIIKDHIESTIVEDIIGSKTMTFDTETQMGETKNGEAEKSPPKVEAVPKQEPKPTAAPKAQEPKSDEFFEAQKPVQDAKPAAKAEPKAASKPATAPSAEASLEAKADAALDDVLATFDL